MKKKAILVTLEVIPRTVPLVSGYLKDYAYLNPQIKKKWTFEFYNNGTLLEVNPDDVSASYELFPGEIKKGECDHGANLTLQIYVREGYDPLRMTHINLTGLRVAH